MRALVLVLPLLAGCLATTGELDTAVTEITGRIDAVARDAQESAEAAREAWRRGEIDYAELQKRLQDIRAATLDVAKETTREVMGELRDTIRARPEVVADTAGDVARGVLPGVPGEIIAMLLASVGTYFAATKKADRDTAWDLEMERAKRAAEGKRG